eukprot:3436620-Alexandrium_andersonii.AAC.1
MGLPAILGSPSTVLLPPELRGHGRNCGRQRIAVDVRAQWQRCDLLRLTNIGSSLRTSIWREL